MIPKTLLQAKTADCQGMSWPHPHTPHTHTCTLQILSLRTQNMFLSSHTFSLGPLLINFASKNSKQLRWFHVPCFDLSPMGFCHSGIVGVCPLWPIVTACHPAVQELHNATYSEEKNSCTNWFLSILILYSVFSHLVELFWEADLLTCSHCEGLKRGLSSFYWLLCVTDATEDKPRAWNFFCQLPSCTFLRCKLLRPKFESKRGTISQQFYTIRLQAQVTHTHTVGTPIKLKEAR